MVRDLTWILKEQFSNLAPWNMPNLSLCEMVISQLTYTAEVNREMLTQAGFELTHLGYQSTALPVELSSAQDILVTT